jgi:hypothetical protein
VAEFFSEIFIFCRSVLLRWSNLFTGGLLAFLLFCYALFAQSAIPTKLVMLLLGVGFLVAVFGAWREQYLKSKPGLDGEILSIVWAQVGEEKTLMLLQLRILNTGEPTIVRDYEASARLADRTELMAMASHIHTGLKLKSATETTTVNKLIYEETTSRIPSGGQAGGG